MVGAGLRADGAGAANGTLRTRTDATVIAGPCRSNQPGPSSASAARCSAITTRAMAHSRLRRERGLAVKVGGGCGKSNHNGAMKLATYKDGSRDGQLVVVSRDLARPPTMPPASPRRLQQVLDDWNFLSPQLEDLYAR